MNYLCNFIDIKNDYYIFENRCNLNLVKFGKVEACFKSENSSNDVNGFTKIIFLQKKIKLLLHNKSE